MLKTRILFCALLLGQLLHAQSNVRAWYADGQVWVVWEVSLPLPETYAVYSKPTPFTSTDQAVWVGRLFKEEYGPGALREQVDSAATYRIPDGNGGIYQLAANEALFVATPHQAGALYFAVVAWGNTTVVQGVNGTTSAVPFQYAPETDPVECHLQKTFVSPFDPDYRCFAFYMWADGRQNQWENRPDFPVMANKAKNGMPSLFLISAPMNLDTTQPFPLSVWLHGGGGTARQSLAGSRQDIHLNPTKGILLAHNDDLFGYLVNTYAGYESVSRHFGWLKNYDPFTGNPPTAVDTIVNYTQRRYLWIDEWLMRHYNIDPNRININGHSMGSRGATMLAKYAPNHYATATVLNNGFEDNEPPGGGDVPFGSSDQNFPTNITGYSGETIHFTRAMNLEQRLSTERDYPLIRSFHGKNDTGSGNQWDAYVVQEYRAADSLGLGTQLFWSERAHGPDTGPDYNDHWINGNSATQQTVVDDIAYEEKTFRSDVSYPAFFNNRLDPQSNDPGDGSLGTGPSGVGDDWGTWGGYHRWDWDNIADLPGYWSALAWLESDAVFANDNSPHNFLTADMCIRKPRQFKPTAGTTIYWRVRDQNTNTTLQSGTAIVQSGDLVVIPGIVVYKANIRHVQIEIATQPVGNTEIDSPDLPALVTPNPSDGPADLFIFAKSRETAQLRIFNSTGSVYAEEIRLHPGENRCVLPQSQNLPPGIYFIQIDRNGQQQSLRWVKM